MAENAEAVETTQPSSKNLRQAVLKLIEEKEKLEKEIQDLQQILMKNNVGMNDPLVDEEGFPLPNVDVYQVRHARHLLIYKQNDHKALMRQIEMGIAEYYHETPPAANGVRGEEDEKDEPTTTTSELETVQTQHTLPFAYINITHPGSPADAAGILQGDMIVEFGSINAQNFRGIADIGTVVQHSHGSAIHVVIQRNGRLRHVQLVPREWNGQGLLGCSVLPV